MPVVYTVGCHGTDNDSNNSGTGGGANSTVQWVYDRCTGPKFLLQGVGSRLSRAQLGLWDGPGDAGLVGINTGRGVEENVTLAVQQVTAEHANHGGNNVGTVNLVGFSRGAVTCFKIANKLSQGTTQNIRVNIFAIDPVPGNLGLCNNHCYKAIKIMNNVDNATVIYAEHERRDAFRPVEVHVNAGYALAGTYELDTMPGNHGGISELGDGVNVKCLGARLVWIRAWNQLSTWGTQFGNVAHNYNDDRILNMYGQIMNDLDKYILMGTADSGWGGAQGENGLGSTGGAVFNKMTGGNSIAAGDRMMQRKTSSAFYRAESDKYKSFSMNANFNIAQGPRRFFCNREHRNKFSARFPALANFLTQIENGTPLSSFSHTNAVAYVNLSMAARNALAAAPHAQTHVANYDGG